MTSSVELRKALEEIENLKQEKDQLYRFVQFVADGLASGHIKSKPIIDFDSSAKTLPMLSLEKIVRDLLASVPENSQKKS